MKIKTNQQQHQKTTSKTKILPKQNRNHMKTWKILCVWANDFWA